MFRSLLDSCGSLIAADEEHRTVHFTHHSVKTYLLSNPTNSDLRNYHINIKEADVSLGEIAVTYLNLGIFNRQLATINSMLQPQAINYPSIVLGSLPQSSYANRLAVKLLRSRRNFKLDIHSQLKSAAIIIEESKAETQTAHFFLSYAQDYWLFHTKSYKPSRVAGSALWQRLINEEVETIKLPWTSSDEKMRWAMQNEHQALIHQSLLDFKLDQSYDKDVKSLLKLLAKKTTDLSFQNETLDLALFAATFLNNKAAVRLLLRNGAKANFDYGDYRDSDNLLQTASSLGYTEIAKLLLENGANVNAKGFWGSALQAASSRGHEKIVRLLLEKGADLNARDIHQDSALETASNNGHLAIVRLLLKHALSVNVELRYGGSALRAAAHKGHEEIKKLLLEYGPE